MSDAIAQAQTATLQLLASLKPSDNPYFAISGLVRSAFIPDLSKSYDHQLYALAAIFIVCLFFVGGSILLRILAREFWLFRIGSDGLIRPHWSLTWSLFAAILDILLVAMCFRTVAYFRNIPTPTDYFAFKSFPWISAWVGGWFGTQGVWISLISHKNSRGKWKLSRGKVWAINSFACLGPILYAGALIPCSTLGVVHSARLIELINELQAGLMLAGSEWKQGDEFGLAQLAPGTAILNQMGPELNGVLQATTQVYSIFGGGSAGLAGLIISGAWMYLNSLRGIVKTSRFHTESTLGAGGENTNFAAVRDTYRSLILTLTCFAVMCSIFSAVCIIVSLYPLRALSTPLDILAETLVPLYTFALFGLPISIMLFTRALESYKLSGKSATVIKMKHLHNGSMQISHQPELKIKSDLADIDQTKSLGFQAGEVKTLPFHMQVHTAIAVDRENWSDANDEEEKRTSFIDDKEEFSKNPLKIQAHILP